MTRHTKTCAILASAIALLTIPSAEAQARGDRAAERRAAVEQRLQALQTNRTDRVTRRTTVFERMLVTTPEMVQDRLTQTEQKVLDALAQADTAAITARLNEAGGQAESFLTSAEFERLSEEQVDKLVVAAGRAATIEEQEVEVALRLGALEVEEFFGDTDPDAIAERLNEIGEQALDLQQDVQDARPDR